VAIDVGPAATTGFGIADGPAFNGQVPSGTASVNETQFGCGGFSTLSISVKKVNLPDGAQLWATLDGLPVGTITLNHGSGSMATDNLGDFAPGGMDQVAIFQLIPRRQPVPANPQRLILLMT